MAYGPVRTPSTQQRPENFLDGLSNSGPAVRLYREGRATGPPEVMTQYLVAVLTGQKTHPKRNIEPKGEITMRNAFAINYVTHDGVMQSPGAFQ